MGRINGLNRVTVTGVYFRQAVLALFEVIVFNNIYVIFFNIIFIIIFVILGG